MSFLITSGSQSTGALLLFCALVFWLRGMWILAPKPGVNIHWIQHPLDHWKSKRVPEKYLLLSYWLCQSLWLWSQQTAENSWRDGNTKPPDLPPEKSVCRSKGGPHTPTPLVFTVSRHCLELNPCTYLHKPPLQSQIGWGRASHQSPKPDEPKEAWTRPGQTSWWGCRGVRTHFWVPHPWLGPSAHLPERPISTEFYTQDC